MNLQKYCRDCKHSEFKSTSRLLMCRSPHTRNLVTKEEQDHTCVDERNHARNGCGYLAEYFVKLEKGYR